MTEDQLAEALFIENWKTHAGIDTEHIAQQCRDAARVFCSSRKPAKTVKKKSAPKSDAA